MKKWTSLFLCFAILITFTGCGSNSSSAPAKDQSLNINKTASSKTSDESVTSEKSTDEVDLDLTTLSSTMVYSEVYNMMTTPEDYIGKTVKMSGLYTYSHDEAKDKYYYACIIQDATACCAQGMEFVLTDDYAYPKDYPEDGEEICVVGIFHTYEEDGYTYCTLKDATLLS